MIIKRFPSGPYATIAYVVVCEETLQAAIIDASPGCLTRMAPFLEAQRATPQILFLTHSHWDHIADAAAIKERYRIPVYIHPEDLSNLESPGDDGIPVPLAQPIPGVKHDGLLVEGQVMTVGMLKFKILHTPGHSPGSISLHLENEGVLFSGDTLFKGTIGNLSIPTSEAHRMWPSLEKLALLPPATVVYPGHGNSTTIGDEGWLSRAKSIFGNS